MINLLMIHSWPQNLGLRPVVVEVVWFVRQLFLSHVVFMEREECLNLMECETSWLGLKLVFLQSLFDWMAAFDCFSSASLIEF